MSVRTGLSGAIALAVSVIMPALAAAQTAAPPWFVPANAMSNADYVRAFDAEFPDVTGTVPATPNPIADPFAPAPASPPPWSAPNYWSGFYFGGQFSYSIANGDFADATQGPIAYSLRELTLESEFAPSNWQVLGSTNHSAPGFGGFVGYNFAYLQTVFGVEANYDQASLSLTAPNSPISRITPADKSGDNYLVNITGSGTVNNLNFGTLRARAGYAFGSFLPYGFVGFAAGRADIHITETTSGQQNPPSSGACLSISTPPCVPFSFPGTAGHDGEWLYGAAAGVGFDIAFTRNIFARAEYEYVYFEPVDGVHLNVNTARVGVGFKF